MRSKLASDHKIIKNIKESHRTLTATKTLATNMTNRRNHREQAQINIESTGYFPGTRKLNNEYDELYQLLTSRTHSYCDNQYN